MSSIIKNFKYYFWEPLFLGAIFVCYSALAETRDGLKVAFLDVGQGDAILWKRPTAIRF